MGAWEIVRYLFLSGLGLLFVADLLPQSVRMLFPPLALAALAYYVAWRTRRILFAVAMSWASFFATGLMLLAVVGIAEVTGAGIMDHLIAPAGGDDMTLADDVRVILMGVATVPLQFLVAWLGRKMRNRGQVAKHAPPDESDQPRCELP
jgi:hypothetical protein